MNQRLDERLVQLGDLYAMHSAELTDMAKRFQTQADALWDQAARLIEKELSDEQGS